MPYPARVPLALGLIDAARTHAFLPFCGAQRGCPRHEHDLASSALPVKTANSVPVRFFRPFPSVKQPAPQMQGSARSGPDGLADSMPLLAAALGQWLLLGPRQLVLDPLIAVPLARVVRLVVQANARHLLLKRGEALELVLGALGQL